MSNEFQTREGGCVCGHVRFTLTSSPLFVHCCHCRWCQRETGSSYALNALIETDRVHLLRGEPEAIVTPTASGSGQKISRCPRCRVALWSNYDYAGIGDAVAFVRVGTLDEPEAIPPDIHIFTDSKQPWVLLAPDIPSVPAFYKASEYWSAASLERRAALFAAKAGRQTP